MRKLGLVLSGGGAKGAYEIGVYKALDVLGVTKFIDAFTGTSVGALNSVLIDDRGIDFAVQLWSELKFSDLIHINTSGISKLHKLGSIVTGNSDETIDGSFFVDMIKNGYPVSQEKIEQIIQSNVSFRNITRKIYVVCSQRLKKMTCFTLNEYDPEVQRKIVLASSAIPGIYRGFEGIKIDDDFYYDGGITPAGNTPILPMYEKGYRKIIAVHLKSNPYTADQCQFVDADILNIIPSRSLGNFITGTLYLNSRKVVGDMELGYYDTINKSADIMKLVNSLAEY